MSAATGSQDDTPLRVVVVIARYPPYHHGGYELRCRDICRELARRGHEVTVVTSTEGSSGVEDDEGVRVVRRLGLYSGGPQGRMGKLRFMLGSRSDVATLRGELVRARAHVLHYWHQREISHALLAVRRPHGCGVVCDVSSDWLLHVHSTGGNWFRMWERTATTTLARLAQGIARWVAQHALRLPVERPPLPPGRAYFTSQDRRKRYLEAGVPVQDATVITSGIQLDKFPFLPERPTEGPIRLLYLGRIKRRKGIHTVVKALCNLPERVQLRVFGPVEEEEYLAELHGIARAGGAGERLEVHAPVDHSEVSTLMRDAHMLVFPSEEPEAFSRLVLEAFASGTPVVGTTLGGTGEVLKEGVTGLTYEPGAADELERQIRAMLASKSARDGIVQRARKLVEETYSIAVTVSQIEELLRAATARAGG